jgi:hypothetical protein
MNRLALLTAAVLVSGSLAIAAGSFILANLFTDSGVVATANSVALFINTAVVPGPIVGAGFLLIVACGGLLALARRRRKSA